MEEAISNTQYAGELDNPNLRNIENGKEQLKLELVECSRSKGSQSLKSFVQGAAKLEVNQFEFRSRG
jgi:hypothetical protein